MVINCPMLLFNGIFVSGVTPVSVFNVDGSPNQAGQISEVVDVVLHYQMHLERMLLAISSLGKQDVILGFPWLKDHNPEVDWQKGEVRMTHCPPQYEGCCSLRREVL